jgi:hypothetical protein
MRKTKIYYYILLDALAFINEDGLVEFDIYGNDSWTISLFTADEVQCKPHIFQYIGSL